MTRFRSDYMTEAEIRDALAAVEWYPGWIFHVERTQFEGLRIWIVGTVPDARHPGEEIQLRIESYLPPFTSDKQLYDWLLWRLCRIATHEAREFFRVNSEIYSDPHAG